MPKIIKEYSSVEMSFAVAAVAGNHPVCQVLKSLSAGVAPWLGLTRLRVRLTTAVATGIGLAAQNARGTATAPVTGVSVSSQDGLAVSGSVATAWSVSPTRLATPYYYREENLLAAVGTEFEWTWPEDDPFTDPVLLWNLAPIAVTGAMQIDARWLEFASQ
jgi:hypothetical protein